MINVAVVGIGNISILYDYNKSPQTAYSHIKAIYLHEEFNLKYVVDIDNKNLGKVQELFPFVEYLDDYKKLVLKDDIDVLVISTPTKTHFQILDEFKNSKIKTFLMEKPLFYNNKEYINLDDIYKDKIVVNYIRRFQDPIINLKKQIQKDDFSNLQKIVVNYVKGFKNNGSHFIDLINFLFENPKIIKSNILSQTEGFSPEDLTYDVFLEIGYKNKTVAVYFIGLDHTQYNLIEFNLYFDNQVVKYINSQQTIFYYDINESREYKDYKFVDEEPSKKEELSKKLMYYVYDNIYKQIVLKDENPASFDNELKNYQFINKVLENKE